jgi:hypothetical protein
MLVSYLADANQVENLFQIIDLGLFFCDGSRIQFVSGVQSYSELSGLHKSRNRIMDESKRGLAQQLLCHFRPLNNLSNNVLALLYEPIQVTISTSLSHDQPTFLLQ